MTSNNGVDSFMAQKNKMKVTEKAKVTSQTSTYCNESPRYVLVDQSYGIDLELELMTFFIPKNVALRLLIYHIDWLEDNKISKQQVT